MCIRDRQMVKMYVHELTHCQQSIRGLYRYGCSIKAAMEIQASHRQEPSWDNAMLKQAAKTSSVGVYGGCADEAAYNAVFLPDENTFIEASKRL